MRLQTKLIVGTGAALLALVASTTFAQTMTQDQAALSPRATPEDAVSQAVQATNGTYAGDCAATSSPADLGKLCSKFVAQRGGLRAYLVGRTFAEFRGWVFVGQSSAGWLPAGTAPFDDTAPALNVPWPAL